MEHQLDDLDQPASVVVGAPSPLVQEILAQLGSRGHHAVSIGGAGFNLDHPDAVEECFAEACGDRRVGVLVHADIPPGAAQPRALMDLDAKGWDLRCESIIRSTLLVFQAAHRRLAAGGSVVLVAPSISLGGEAGLAAWSAAAEAQRNLAKVAARRWGGAGVRVNVVSVPPALLGDDSDTEMGRDSGPPSPAPGEPAATVSAVADLVCMLVGPESRSLTGSTLVADGGSLMVP